MLILSATFLQNHIVERIWSEVNSRVNYPIKATLVEMMESGDINVEDPLHMFCTSWFIIRVAFVGVELFLNSWNYHPIPGVVAVHMQSCTVHVRVLYMMLQEEEGVTCMLTFLRG